MKSEKPYPPRWTQRFVEWYCKPQLAEDLIGDLNEYFERNLETKGPFRAKLIYAVDAFKFLRTYTVRTPKLLNLLINCIMIGSYIKTSGRNVMRNKLFSSINIVGLSISMSVGLLLIAFLHDVLSYDRFHENGNRTYRVINWPTFQQQEEWYASTSAKTGRLIREKVPGVEEVTILRAEFSGDAAVGDKNLPLNGFWADPSFLKVFSFPMLKGDPATALSDPYSIVLTEESAKKLFGDAEALGQTIRLDTSDYQVTGVLKDVPFFSHIRFEALGSFSTIELLTKDEDIFGHWTSMWSNYVYLRLPENADLKAIQANLDVIAKEENAVDERRHIDLSLQPLYNIALGKDMSNPIGPVMSITVVWIVLGLAIVVILSACFNYTNLSIARSMRRFKEVGLRKVIGAGRNHVRHQFLFEAIIISLLALVFSFALFLLLRTGFRDIAPELQRMVKLEITAPMIGAFIVFSIVVGIIAGFLPALLISRVSVIQALKDVTSVKVFKHLSMRRALVVAQYTLTLMFITATAIGYKQYKSMLAFDLGYETENILNIRIQGNKAEVLVKQFGELPEVTQVSKSTIVTSVGSYWGNYAKYKNKDDSTLVWFNIVDHNYLPLHDHEFIAGHNFIAHPATDAASTEVIVNQQFMKRFMVGDNDPMKAVGEEITFGGAKLTVVGVVKDFHYGTVDNKIEPVVFTCWTPENTKGFVNLKIQSTDLLETMARLEQTWKSIDPVHSMDAVFYKDSLERAYNEYSSIITIIGFLSFLAISVASMGLFGMVVFTTETRLKEISIRKVMGASSGNLVFLLSRGFLLLLSVSAVIALPATYFLLEGVVLTNFPFHAPIQGTELFAGLFGVLLIAFIMIGSQTMKAARSNPAEVLKSE